jgi:hypothetical protein
MEASLTIGTSCALGLAGAIWELIAKGILEFRKSTDHCFHVSGAFDFGDWTKILSVQCR